MPYLYYSQPTSYSYDAHFIQQQLQHEHERQFQLQFQREREAQLQRERQKQLEQQRLLAAMYMAEQQEREYEYERQRQLKARLYKQRQQQLIAQQQERYQCMLAERAKQQELYEQRYQQFLSAQKQIQLDQLAQAQAPQAQAQAQAPQAQAQAQASPLEQEIDHEKTEIPKTEKSCENDDFILNEDVLISILNSFGITATKPKEHQRSEQEEAQVEVPKPTSEVNSNSTIPEEISEAPKVDPNSAIPDEISETSKVNSNSPISEEISEAPKIDPNSTIPEEISETPASYSRPPLVVVAPKGVEIKTSIPKDLSSEEIANKLSAVEKQVTRHGDTLNRLQRYVNGSAQSSDSDANISSRVVSSRLKVLQKAQLELESLYSDLDDIVVPRSDTENKKTKKDLTKRAVTIADKMDILSAELQSRKSEVSERELSVSESSESENDEKVNFTPESDTEFVKIESPGYVSNDNDSDSSTSSLKSTGSLRRVTIETVPDADSDFDY